VAPKNLDPKIAARLHAQNAHAALAHGNGGMLSSQATAILGTAEALR